MSGTTKPADFAFQVNLSGIIELLSRHLYSGPQVYLRELLQNATDAIEARRQLEPGHTGEISVELVTDPAGGATLIFEDNGIGLTEEEVHKFLSTIGLSSKSDELARRRGDFIGQFGIGLLSCFMVTDEIVMITRSARKEHSPVEWKGTSDGRYSLRRLEQNSGRTGTKVYLRARPDTLEYFQAKFIRQHLQSYGGLLPHRIELAVDNQRSPIQADTPPWKGSFSSPQLWRTAALAYGEEVFGMQFMDCLPLDVEELGLKGVAFILPSSPSLAARRADRVYVKNMLITDKADQLLPEWAFFARCVFNATGLNPGASRETLQDDERLQSARDGLERNLRDYLLNLARHDHERLRTLVKIHYRAIKVLAADDDEFYRLFIDWLPFETSQGEQTLKSVRQSSAEILYAGNVDTFRQMAQVAAAQSLCVINAGYVCDVELLEKLPDVFPEISVRRLEPDEFLDNLEDLSLTEQEQAQAAMDDIESVLGRFRCDLEVKCFQPADLPALYTLGQAARFQRDVQRAKDVANDLWAGVLNGIRPGQSSGERSRLCLNWKNPVIRKLFAIKDANVLRRAVELLYVQSLLQGHYPLDANERRVLSDGLTGLIDMAISNRT
ncbi:MAG TPA: HSP90 family protein [Verrucomicrobiae bacterium]|nr:HSP90 family protein [Verrucomicrobiae bacterium]